MRIALVAAVARNGVIGGDGDLLWRIRDDLKWFKRQTMNKPMIMGRKTFQSIGVALPGRDSIVMSKRGVIDAPGAFITDSLSAASGLARLCAQRRDVEEICVIGGGEIYKLFLPHADRIYLTKVDAAPLGDTVFPEFNPGGWSERFAEKCAQSSVNDYACEFFILDRNGA